MHSFVSLARIIFYIFSSSYLSFHLVSFLLCTEQVSKLEKLKDYFKRQVEDLERKVKDVEGSKDDKKKKQETQEENMSELQKTRRLIVDENENLKSEFHKGVEDIARALGDGYGRCLGRISDAGFDVAGHSFKDYIRDYAAFAAKEDGELAT